MPLEQLLNGALVITLVLISIPLHELCHLITYAMLGGNIQNTTVKLFTMNWEYAGYIKPKDNVWTFRIPKFLKGKEFEVGFILGISGGTGVALLSASVLRFLAYYPTTLLLLYKPLMVILIGHFLYSITEGLKVASIMKHGGMQYKEL